MKAMVNKEQQKKGLVSRGLYIKTVYMVSKNYIYDFGLVINPFTMKLLDRFGARIWKDVSIEWKGIKIPRYIILRDMRIMAGDPKL